MLLNPPREFKQHSAQMRGERICHFRHRRYCLTLKNKRLMMELFCLDSAIFKLAEYNCQTICPTHLISAIFRNLHDKGNSNDAIYAIILSFLKVAQPVSTTRKKMACNFTLSGLGCFNFCLVL